MKKFKFQLEALRKVTQMKKEQAEVELAKASKLLQEQLANREKLKQEMEDGLADYDRLTKAARINVGTLMTYNSFFAWKREQLQLQDTDIAQSEAIRSQRLQELIEIANKLKAIEQLKQKKREEFQQEQFLAEQKELDEIGLQIYTRTARAGEKQ